MVDLEVGTGEDLGLDHGRTLVLQQPGLDQPGAVEALDPSADPAAAAAAPAGISPTSSARSSSAPRPAASDRSGRRSRAAPRPPSPRRSCSPAPSRPGKLQAERPDTRKATVALPDRRGDRARNVECCAAQVDVERDQRTPRPDDDAARSRMEVGRPEVGRQAVRASLAASSSVPPRRKNAGPRPGEARRRGTRARRARRAGRRAPRPPPLRVPCRSAAAAQRGRRRRRRSAGARPRVASGRSGRGPTRLRGRARRRGRSSRHREHRAVVVGIECTSSSRAPRDSGTDRLDRGRIAPSEKFGTDSSGSTALL